MFVNKKKVNYPREGAEDYAELAGGAVLAPGRFGKAVKPLVVRDGWEIVRPAWRHFVTVMRQTLEYATPEYFARTYPQWILEPKSTASEQKWKLVGEWYETSKRGRIIRVPASDPREAL